jgi:hypothetical protein
MDLNCSRLPPRGGLTEGSQADDTIWTGSEFHLASYVRLYPLQLQSVNTTVFSNFKFPNFNANNVSPQECIRVVLILTVPWTSL